MPGGMPEHLKKGPILERLERVLSGLEPTTGASDPSLRDRLLKRLGKEHPDALEDVLAGIGVLLTNEPLSEADLEDFEDELLTREVRGGVITLSDAYVQRQVQQGAVSRPLQITGSENDKDHLRNDWLTPREDGGWWAKAAGPVEEILRRGMIEAAQISIAKDNLPVDAFWLCAGPDAGEYQIGVECFISWNRHHVLFLILTPEHLYGDMNQMRNGNGMQKGAARKAPLREEPVGMLVVRPNAHSKVIVKRAEHRRGEQLS